MNNNFQVLSKLTRKCRRGSYKIKPIDGQTDRHTDGQLDNLILAYPANLQNFDVGGIIFMKIYSLMQTYLAYMSGSNNFVSIKKIFIKCGRKIQKYSIFAEQYP